MKKRLRVAINEGKYLLKSGNSISAQIYSGLLAAGLKYPVSVSLPPYRLSVRTNTPDLAVAREMVDGTFAKAIEAAKPLRHSLVIDAGGYIGTSAIAFATAFPEATVVSIEPSYENFRLLKKNTKAFPNIKILNKAIGPSIGKARLLNRGTGEWRYTLVRTPIDCDNPSDLHEAEIITIESILRSFSKTGIDLLKIDIEGAEKELFSSECKWLSDTRVIFVELHDRIQPGCEAAFCSATSTRKNTRDGERILSVL